MYFGAPSRTGFVERNKFAMEQTSETFSSKLKNNINEIGRPCADGFEKRGDTQIDGLRFAACR